MNCFFHFFFWYLGAICTFGLLNIYLYPYLVATLTRYYKSLCFIHDGYQNPPEDNQKNNSYDFDNSNDEQRKNDFFNSYFQNDNQTNDNNYRNQQEYKKYDNYKSQHENKTNDIDINQNEPYPFEELEIKHGIVEDDNLNINHKKNNNQYDDIYDYFNDDK